MKLIVLLLLVLGARAQFLEAMVPHALTATGHLFQHVGGCYEIYRFKDAKAAELKAVHADIQRIKAHASRDVVLSRIAHFKALNAEYDRMKAAFKDGGCDPFGLG